MYITMFGCYAAGGANKIQTYSTCSCTSH